MVKEMIKDESEIIYENLIYYRVCETMYIEMKKTTYETFGNMCSNLRDSICNGMAIRGQLNRLVKSTIKTISELYGLDYDETLNFIIEFLRKNMWEQYHNIVVTFYTKTLTSYQ